MDESLTLKALYTAGAAIVVILSTIVVWTWKIRGEMDKLITRDEIEAEYVKTSSLRIEIKECFREYARDSLELDSKYVTMAQLEISNRATLENVGKLFSAEIRRLEQVVAGSNSRVEGIPEQLNEVNRSIGELNSTINHLRGTLLDVASEIKEAGDLIDSNHKELTGKIHKIELNCAGRKHA